MKLATVIHSLGLGLTGSVLDLSNTLVTVDTYIKETPIAKSRLLANIGPDGANSLGHWYCISSPTARLACPSHFVTHSLNRRAW